MDEFDDSGQINVSKYNSAFFNNQRMHELWNECHKSKKNGRYSDWSCALDTIWSELASDVKEDDDDDKNWKKMTLNLAKTGLKNWSHGGGFNKISPTQQFAKTTQYWLLINKEIFLRRLQNKQGKGTAYKQGWEAYLDD